MPLMGTSGGGGQAGGGIYGALPWGGGGAATAIANPRDPSSIAAGYQAAYNNALAMNTANYNNILAGYNDTLATQTSAQQAIESGYTDLYNNVLSRVTSIGQARADAINRASDQSLARGSQQLIDRGLGNTTVQSSLNRGIESDRNARQLELSDWLAQTQGGYMSNLGLAGLANRSRGLDAQVAERNRQLDWMNSVTAKYPDAGIYATLASNAGMADAMGRRSSGGGSFGGASNVAPGPQYGKLGYTGYQEPYYGSSGGGGSAGALGVGSGGGFGNVAGGIGAYINAGQDFGTSYGASGDQDLSAYGLAAAGAASDVWGAGPDLSQSYVGPEYYTDGFDPFAQ